MEKILSFSATELQESIEKVVKEDSKLRSEILSIGIPILMADGKTILRGPEIKVPTTHGLNELEVSPEAIDKWAEEGWVDLREKNMAVWFNRFNNIMEEVKAVPNGDTSSQYDRNYEYWRPGDNIQVGKVVGWIFLFEEEGIRMKE